MTPPTAYIYAALAAAVLTLAGGWAVDNARWTAKYEALVSTHATAVAEGERTARRKEAAAQKATDEVRTDAQEKLVALSDDLRAADTTAERLRKANDDLRRAATSAATAGRSEAATRALVLYSELLDARDRRVGELAAEADRRRIAGLACERYADEVAAPDS